MANVTKIQWIIDTGNRRWNGTDTPVAIEIFRDDDRLFNGTLELGDTAALNRGTHQVFTWHAKPVHPIDAVGDSSESGAVAPYSESFPDGIVGHLKVRISAEGDDAWHERALVSKVFTGHLHHVPNTIDELEWVEVVENFGLNQTFVLSTDWSEGSQAVMLLY